MTSSSPRLGGVDGLSLPETAEPITTYLSPTWESPCAVCVKIESNIQEWHRFVKEHDAINKDIAICTWEAYLRSAVSCLTCRQLSDILKEQLEEEPESGCKRTIVITSSTYRNLYICLVSLSVDFSSPTASAVLFFRLYHSLTSIS
jgi:hypothetical protein